MAKKVKQIIKEETLTGIKEETLQTIEKAIETVNASSIKYEIPKYIDNDSTVTVK